MKHNIIKIAITGAMVTALALATLAEAQVYTTTSTTGTSVFVTTTGTVNPIGPNIFTGRDMSVGSTGADVALLQGLLIELGFLTVPAGIPLGYYGPLTRSAVARYQASRGVINTGYYGPLTKQAMVAHFGAQNWLTILYPVTY